MATLSSWLQICSILVFIDELNTYVLLAANVDDFRNIARKIVPETLADKLARLASVSAKQKTRIDASESQHDYGSDTEYDFDKNERGDILEEEKSDIKRSVYVRDWNMRVNFEELVQRVKERLAKEMKEEIQKRVQKPVKGIENESVYDTQGVQNMDDQMKISVNKNKFSSPKDDGHFSYSNSKNKRYTDYKMLTEVTRNYKTFTSDYYKDYQGSKKVNYPDKSNKPEYVSYQDNEKENIYDNRDYEGEKYKIGSEYISNINMNLSENVKIKGNVEKNIYQNDDEDSNSFKVAQNNNKDINYGIGKGLPKSKERDVNGEFIKKHDDSHKYIEEDAYDNNSKENFQLSLKKIHNSLKETSTDKNKFVVDNGESLYNKFDLISKRKNDSYEDYVIPKEESIFESDEILKTYNKNYKKEASDTKYKPKENSRFKIKNNPNFDDVKPFKNVWKIENENAKTVDYDEIKEKSQEIKAKTESLWFDDRSKDTEIITELSTSKRRVKGTKIPTRETYKMASPNYYISLPTVAEKYDSDEPLPERDRERQIIKHFVNPPASINKKIRLL